MTMQIEHNGRVQSATAWAREIGITYHVLRWRLQHWTKDRALTTPKQPRRGYAAGHGCHSRSVMSVK
jgi:hypothetical protein